CITLLSQSTFAQDGGFPIQSYQEPDYQEFNLNEDKLLIYEVNENKSSRSTAVTTRDSVAIKAKARVSKKTSDDKKEEDALSFNFLYYIIQKYKISDIVDQ
ncbi:MAG: hypothetical protein RIF39_03780, partial [Cyclobacteriaceae bacterium]